MRPLAILLAILMCITPIAYAQSSEYYEASERGKTDAKLDVGNKGMGVGLTVGGLGGCLLGLIGGTLGVLGSYIWSSGSTKQVPFNRIKQLEREGKSAEFISTYRAAYQAEAKGLKNKNALVGSVGGCLVGTLVAVLVVLNASE